ncbi:hypothetical protein [Streptosporangium sp. NPDC006007]|uniref:hypothetical protein n=1 Tax=Streptosporangium sp. NPDC006007 TaxID=3154575 RepID=UPI0033A5EF79
MTLTVERRDARAWPEEQLGRLFSEGFPTFITADQVAGQYIGRVREWFTDLDLMLVDADGAPVATGWAVPQSSSRPTEPVTEPAARERVGEPLRLGQDARGRSFEDRGKGGTVRFT